MSQYLPFPYQTCTNQLISPDMNPSVCCSKWVQMSDSNTSVHHQCPNTDHLFLLNSLWISQELQIFDERERTERINGIGCMVSSYQHATLRRMFTDDKTSAPWRRPPLPLTGTVGAPCGDRITKVRKYDLLHVLFVIWRNFRINNSFWCVFFFTHFCYHGGYIVLGNNASGRAKKRDEKKGVQWRKSIN